MTPGGGTAGSGGREARPGGNGGSIGDRYRELARRLREAVLGGPGETAPSLRAAVEAEAASLSGGGERADHADRVPADLIDFVEKVARGAYRVTPEDVGALKAAGYSEAAIFEVTVSAAMGAASGRLERGLSALKGES